VKGKHRAVVFSVFVVVIGLFGGVLPSQAAIMVWDAYLGRLPTELTSAWDWVPPSSGEEATMASGVLTIRSENNVADYVYFRQLDSDISMPNNLWIEARARYVSGTDTTAGRTPMCILFTTEPNVGNSVWIGEDRIAVMTALWTEGATANVDTNDAFHTYRIEVDGISAGNTFRVYYDGAVTLTGTTFSDVTSHGSVARVVWGDGTKYEGGVSEWQYVAHNASALTSVWLIARRDGPNILIGWSTAAAGFVLQWTPTLFPQTQWQDDSNTLIIADHEYRVILSPVASGFFRLRGQ